MSITIEIPLFLRPFTANNDTVEVSGATVGDCLDTLAVKYPEMREWLFDSTGILKAIVVVNRQIVPQKDLNTAVSDNDQISIIMPAGGG